MPPKRKRDDENEDDRVLRPPAGTRTFETGQAVKEGLASGSRQGQPFHLCLGTAAEWNSLCCILPADPYLQIEASIIDIAPYHHGHTALYGCIAWLRGDTQCLERRRPSELHIDRTATGGLLIR